MATVTEREVAAAVLANGAGKDQAVQLVAIAHIESGFDTSVCLDIDAGSGCFQFATPTPQGCRFDGTTPVAGPGRPGTQQNLLTARLATGDRVMVGTWQFNSHNFQNNVATMNGLLDLFTAAHQAVLYPLAAWAGDSGGRAQYIASAQQTVDSLWGMSKADLMKIVHGAGSLPGEQIPHAVGNIGSAFKDMGEAVIWFVTWITSPNTWVRVGLAIAGAGLVLGAVWFMAKDWQKGT